MNRSKKNPPASTTSASMSKSNSTSSKSSSTANASSIKKAAVKRTNKREEVDEMDEGIYELSHIIGKFIEDDGSIFYKVAWVGFPKPTIEPAENLSSASRLVEEFERKLAEGQARKKAAAAAALAANRTQAQTQSQQSADKEQSTSDEPSLPAADTQASAAQSTDPALKSKQKQAEPVVEIKMADSSQSQSANESTIDNKVPVVEHVPDTSSNTASEKDALTAPLAASSNNGEDASVPSHPPSSSPSAEAVATIESASVETATVSRTRKQESASDSALILSGKRSRRKTDDLSPLRPEEERALRQEEKLNRLLQQPNKKQRTSNGEVGGKEGDEDEEDAEPEWQMRKIIGTRKGEDGIVFYKVDWMPHETTGKEYDPTWEPRANILDDVLIQEFNERIKKGRKIRTNGTIDSQSPANSQSPATNSAAASTGSPSVTASVEAPAESTVGIIDEDEKQQTDVDAIMKDAENQPSSISVPASDALSKSPSASIQPVIDDVVMHNKEEVLNSPEAVADEQKQPSPNGFAKTFRNLRQMVGLE